TRGRLRCGHRGVVRSTGGGAGAGSRADCRNRAPARSLPRGRRGPDEAELAELRAYARMAAEERRGLRERGEWPAVLEAAREELEASGWHMGTAVRALAARLKLTHRTAEEAVGEVLDAVALRH